MAGVSITTRPRVISKKFPRGKGYQVRYRVGGRYTRQLDAGTFPSYSLAQTRRMLVLGMLAAGQDPAVELQKLEDRGRFGNGMGDAFDRFIADSAKSVSAGTLEVYRSARARVVPILGEQTPPEALTVKDIQQLIRALEDVLSAEVVRAYVGKTGMVLAHAGLEVNPARSDLLKFPKVAKRKPPILPSNADSRAIRAWAWAQVDAPRTSGPGRQPKDTRKKAIALEALECFGVRCEDVAALMNGDLDRAERKIHWHSKTDAGYREMPCPERLFEWIESLVPEGAPAEHLVFGGVRKEQLGRAITSAVQALGLAPTTPHKFRHRRISLWRRHGIDGVTVKNWAGHAKESMQDVYAHVVIDASDDEWKSFWVEAYDRPVRVPLAVLEEMPG